MRMASVRDKGEPMKGDAPTKTNNVVYERAIFFSERFIIKESMIVTASESASLRRALLARGLQLSGILLASEPGELCLIGRRIDAPT
jgi:hypothetical protein